LAVEITDVMENYLIIKSLHIIFVVTWFAGLFYMFRLFVYHAEAARKEEPAAGILMNQYTIMEKRLWYAITWPSCILTLLFGFWLMYLQPGYLKTPWMHIKLFFVLLLFLYQLYGQKVIREIQLTPLKYTSIAMRFWNEVPTIILIAVVFIVVMKDSVSWLWGTAGIIGTAIVLTLVIKAYKKRREQNQNA
jgi:putative membrane protein